MRNVKGLRSELLDLVDPTHRGPVGHLIDAMVAWSSAAGLRHDPPGGVDPVLKVRLGESGGEVWAIYPTKEFDGAKLSLAPGHTEHGADLRRIASQLTSGGTEEDGWTGKKLDLSLPALAARDDWSLIFDALNAAVEFQTARSR